MKLGLAGGERLQAKLDEIARGLTQASVRVGFLENATYDDGTPVALVAAVNEFGRVENATYDDGTPVPSVVQPPRPFFRDMVAQKSPDWGKDLAKQLKATDYNVPQAMDRMGQGIKGQLQQSIVDLVDPPLAPATVAKKGFDKPLIDTDHMLKSVDYEVNE